MHKTYYLIDGGGFINFLKGYILGPNIERLLSHYLEKQKIVPKAGKFLGRTFDMGRGITQGDPASPII